MSEATTDTITAQLNDLNQALEENRKQSERLKDMSNQIYSEVEENKENRLEIERKLDLLYSQIKQQKNG